MIFPARSKTSSSSRVFQGWKFRPGLVIIIYTLAQAQKVNLETSVRALSQALQSKAPPRTLCYRKDYLDWELSTLLMLQPFI